MTSADASYFDGAAARRRAVLVEVRPGGLAILEGGAEIAFWPFADLRLADAPDGTMRLGAANAPELARLEVRDAALSRTIAERCGDLRARKEAEKAGTA